MNTNELHEAKSRMMAHQLGVSYEDAISFLGAVAFWMQQGLPFELAVQRHMQLMQQGCALIKGMAK